IKQQRDHIKNKQNKAESKQDVVKSLHGINKKYRDYEEHDFPYYDNIDESNGDETDEIAGLGKNWNTIDCVNCENDNTYTREFLLNNDLPCPTKARKFTDEEMQDYRDDFFNFRNKTNQSSS